MRKETMLKYTVTAKEIGEWIAATMAKRAGLKPKAIDYRLIEWENGDATWTVTTTEDDAAGDELKEFGGIFEHDSRFDDPVDHADTEEGRAIVRALKGDD